MFVKLRRAKSFVHRSKRQEEQEIDLSESSHLKGNIVINNAVLQKQKALNSSRETLHHPDVKLSQRQASRSHEHLNDMVLEQLRQRNFGDSYSKKDVQQLKNEPQGFQRGQPPYVSQRAFHRRSYVGEADEKKTPPKTCGDVVVNNFDRKNKMYWSERLPSATTAQPGSSQLSGSSGDFLLQRRGISMHHDNKERNPPFVPKPKLTRKKSDLFDMSGLRNLFQRFKTSHSSDDAKDMSDSGTSTISSSGSFTYVKVRPVKGETVSKKREEGGGSEYSSCSNVSTASSTSTTHSEVLRKGSDVSVNCQEQKPTERHEQSREAKLIQVNRPREELSRKRLHNETKPVFDRSRPTYNSERISRESRKKSFDRINHATNQNR